MNGPEQYDRAARLVDEAETLLAKAQLAGSGVDQLTTAAMLTAIANVRASLAHTAATVTDDWDLWSRVLRSRTNVVGITRPHGHLQWSASGVARVSDDGGATWRNVDEDDS